MKIVGLTNNESKIKEYNDLCEKLKTEVPSIDWEKSKIKTIYDKFIPYNIWIKDLLQEKSLNIVKDEIEDINNIYIADLNWEYDLERLTDYKFNNKYRSFNYGVCDNATQIIHNNKNLLDENKQYILIMTPIFKCNQEKYGWRWHKWGEYIGIQNPKHEYLVDEENIDLIYVYEIKNVVLK